MEVDGRNSSNFAPTTTLPELGQSTKGGSSRDDVLQKHYLRLQKQLVGMTDRKLVEMGQELNIKETNLKRVSDERQNFAVELYKSRVEATKLGDTLQHAKTQLERIDGDRRVAELDCDALEKEVYKTEREKKVKELELGETRQRVEELTQVARQHGEISAAFSTDLKIQKRMTEKTKKELENSELRRRQLLSELDDERKRSEAILSEKLTLEGQLNNQKSEMAIAQTAIDKMNREINRLMDGKKNAEKAWEEAISAMARRDHTLQTVQDTVSRDKERLTGAEVRARAVVEQRDELEIRLKEKERECAALYKDFDSLKHAKAVAESKVHEIQGSLTAAEVAESLYRQDLERTNKKNDTVQEQLKTREAAVAFLRKRMATLKDEYEHKGFMDANQRAAEREEQARAEMLAENAVSNRLSDAQQVRLRHHNAELQMEILQLQTDLTAIKAERDTLRAQVGDVNGQFNMEYEESKKLRLLMERKEHDMNILKAQVAQLGQWDKNPLQPLLSSVKKDLAQVKSENDRLRMMWLEAQKENIKAKDVSAKAVDDYMSLKTQITVNDVVKVKTAAEVDGARREAADHKAEAARLHAELKRLQPVIEQLKRRNAELESAVSEQRMQTEEAKIDGTTGIVMLKAEVRRLQQSRKEVNVARLADEKTSSVLERKLIVAREAAERLKTERDQLRRSEGDLRGKCDVLKQELENLRTMCARQQEWLGIKQGQDNKSKRDGSGFDGSSEEKMPWMSFATTPNGNSISGLGDNGRSEATSAKSSLMDANGNIPDIAHMQLKLSTLSTEKQHLLTENDILNRKLDETSKRLSAAERTLSEASQRVSGVERDLARKDREVRSISQRCLRAEKAAAYIEAQFKEARPNTKIDFQIPGDVSPSAQLLAALIVPGLSSSPSVSTSASSQRKDSGLLSVRRDSALGGGRRESISLRKDSAASIRPMIEEEGLPPLAASESGRSGRANMAGSFHKIWSRAIPEIVDDYFKSMREAEEHREQERTASIAIQRIWRGHSTRLWIQNQTDCAVIIQKSYRGYKGRCRFEQRVMEYCKAKRMKTYNAAATALQRIWRGYYTRQRIFDFYARKAYLALISERVVEMRALLAEREASDQAIRTQAQRKAHLAKMEALAGRLHHLVGTRAIPGVFSTGHAKDGRSEDGFDDEDRDDDEGVLSEDKIKSNKGFKDWVEKNVTAKRNVASLKPLDMDNVPVEKKSKVAQGPFLPLFHLEKKKFKPFRPSLRVQTNYYDTDEYLREERANEMTQRMSHTFYLSVRHPVLPVKPEFWRASEPYKTPITSLERFADKESRQAVPGKKPFKNLTRPVPFFEDYGNQQ
ncbi:hypothetical protein SmJEL517_g00860 [Synchytrium microbalum]|uniref:Uncharacterized protein n=1 Tax=Synchytrium microbalum TaxID=1806994 RepID=A0A507CGB4_9FUNG|nr:uncharacterized protein SmJEL517_g00860 [Synchytrium microbalum]TPX37056.1 hypothetical protein SmJEL517_g00860 [Synchytrium microbalum]